MSLIGAFTLAAVVGAFLFVMWIAGYGDAGRPPDFPGRFQRLGLRPFERRQRLLQRHQGRRGHPSHVLQERSPPGRSRHRRQLRRADRPEHQGAARDRRESPAPRRSPCSAGRRPGRRLVGAERPGRRSSTPNSRCSCRTFSTTSARSRSGPRRFWTTPRRSSPTIPRRSIRRSRMSMQFSKALADNAPGVDAALKSVGEIGKQIGPLAARLQTLSDDADRVVQSIDAAADPRHRRQRPELCRRKAMSARRSCRQAPRRQCRFDSLDASERRCFRQGPGRQRPQCGRDAEKPGRRSARRSSRWWRRSKVSRRTLTACSRRSIPTRFARSWTTSRACRRRAFGRRSRRQASCRQLRFDPFDPSERRRLRQDPRRQRPQRRCDAEEPGRDQQDGPAGGGANPDACRENANRLIEGGRSGQGSRRRRQCADVQPGACRRARTISRLWCATAPRSPIISTRFGQAARRALADVDQLGEGDRLAKDRRHRRHGRRGRGDGAAEQRQHRPYAQELRRAVRQAQQIGRQGRRRVDGRPKLPWVARHKGGGRPDQRGGAVGQEARRRHRRAGEGHRGRPQPVHQFGLARIRGARGRGEADDRRHRPRGALAWAESQVSSSSGRDPRCPNITAGNDGAQGGWISGPIEIFRRRARAGARALAACASGPAPTMYRSCRREAAAGARVEGADPGRPADRDGQPRQRSHPGARIADAGHARGRPLVGVAAGAFPRAAGAEFPERGARPLDRRRRRRTRITKSISTSAPSSSTPRPRKSMSTSPPGSSRLAAGGSWRTRFSPCGSRSRQLTAPTWRRRWIRRLRRS